MKLSIFTGLGSLYASRCTRLGAAVLLLLVAPPGLAAQGQGGQQPTSNLQSSTTPILTPRLDSPITEEEIAEFLRIHGSGPDHDKNETNQNRTRCAVDPNARPDLVVPLVPEMAHPIAGETIEGAGTLTLFKSHLLTDAETSDSTSASACEPSIAMNGRTSWVTGNWFSSVSSNYGDSYTYFNPATNFPPAAGGFCCDQVAHFDRTRDLMFYYLQYVADGTGSNIIRLAVSRGMENQAENSWYWYDLSPASFGYSPGEWFDFPGLAVGANSLYITTNINGGVGDRAICIRLALDDLAVAGSVSAFNFSSSLPNLRLAQGAGTTMFIGTQVDTNTLRVYRWPETGTVSSVDRDVNAWAQGSSAPDPGGVDWIAFDFNDILAAHVIGNEVFFMWGAAASGGFPFPHIRIARFSTSTTTLTGQGQIWSTTVAWAYPDSHPADYGGLGVVLYYGGGGYYATLVAAAADIYGGSTLGPMSSLFIAAGNRSPGAARWGDYVTIRRASPFDNTWIAAGFTMNSSAPGSDTEVRTFWFGRGAYTPPATRTIYVDGSVTNPYQDGTISNPYDTVREGFFAAYDGDTVIIDADTYSEAPLDTLDRNVQVLKSGAGDVVID